MKTKNIIIVLLSLFLVAFAPIIIAGELKPDLSDIISETPADEKVSVIILFEDRPTPADISVIKSDGASIKYQYTVIDAVAAQVPAQAADKIAKRAFVKLVEPDYEVKLVLDESIYEIEAEKVWENDLTGRGVNVAILDTGIFNHNTLIVTKEVDFTEEGTEDLHGHGTHVAGVVASQDLTYKGVAPNVNLFNIKVLNKEGSGYGSDVIKGIEWAVDNNADILSLSFGAEISECDGTDAISKSVDKAVSEGIIAVVASGNSGPNSETITSPGCAKEAITVGASDGEGVASFSSRGPTADGRVKPDLVAPGIGIISTWLNNEFKSLSGTSASTPHVSGVIALLLENDSSLNINDLKNILSLGAKDLGLDENTQGAGKINAYESYLILINNSEEIVEDEPVVDDPVVDEPEDEEKEEEKIFPGFGERARNPSGAGYGLTRAWERIQLAFTFNNEKESELYLRFAERRLLESLEVLEEDEEKAKELLEEYEQNLEQVNEISEIAQQIGENTTKVTELVARATLIHEEVLRDVLERVPEQAKPSIQRAINNSRTGNENALRVMQENNPEKAAEIHLESAEKSVDSIRERVERNEMENDEIIKEVEERIRKAEEINGNIGDEKKREILERVSNLTSKHKEALEETLKKVPEQAKPEIEKAIERANQEQERATEAIKRIPSQIPVQNPSSNIPSPTLRR